MVAVWNKIEKNDNKNEILNILNNEMKESLCKCFTGRLSRLINCLNGFDEDVEIKINDNEQIGNIILLIKEELLSKSETNEIDVNKWRELTRKELEEREYDSDVINKWLEYID